MTHEWDSPDAEALLAGAAIASVLLMALPAIAADKGSAVTVFARTNRWA